MINYDSVFNLSSDVTCNWCIHLDALQSIALKKTSQENPKKESKKITNIELYTKTKTEEWGTTIQRRRLNWLGHLISYATTSRLALTEYLRKVKRPK